MLDQQAIGDEAVVEAGGEERPPVGCADRLDLAVDDPVASEDEPSRVAE